MNMNHNAVARPLPVLAKLMKDDIKQGDEAAKSAAEKASMPYYQAAGEKMLEAKGQLPHGEFVEWCQRNSGKSKTQCALYMSYASTTLGVQKSASTDFSSLDDFKRAQGHDRPSSGRVQRDWAADNSTSYEPWLSCHGSL